MSDTKVTDIDAQEAPAAPAAAEPKKAAGNRNVTAKEAGIGNKRVKIVIHQGEGDMGNLPVDVFVNGMGFQIKRGEHVEVPVEVVSVLNDAVVTTYADGKEVHRPRFPFSVLS